MSSITIKDTGKYSLTASVLSGESIAYGDSGEGTELTIKNAQLSYKWSSLVDDTDVPGKKIDNDDTQAFDFAEVDSNGVSQPKWVLSVVFKSTEEDDMKTFGRLLYMVQTKGYKELYSSTGNGFNDMISYCKYGQRESDSESPATIDYVNVRITGVTANQSADKKFIRMSVNLTETA